MASLRVLVAEDDPLVAITLTDQIAALGHTVVAVASDGQEAIEMAAREQPDIAVLDIKMPNVDGITAAETITANQDIPLLMLTAYNDRHLILRAAEAGAMAYLLKPASQETLSAQLSVALARHREKQALQQKVHDLEETLAERSIIDKAKAILMERVQLTEDEAYSRMRQRAREKRIKMVAVAQTIIAAEEFLTG
ncbi:MAG: response regulator [Herpetosiphonaceae bacterium]|nr:response regulator [Herpetosiphonaceae bacterium]